MTSTAPYEGRTDIVGVCPACQGNGRREVPESSRCYIKHNARWGHWGLAGYQPKGDGPFADGTGYEGGTLPCTNCGGQYMATKARGVVPLRPDGTPCLHDYVGVSTPAQTRRCVHHRECRACGDRYMIDSGD